MNESPDASASNHVRNPPPTSWARLLRRGRALLPWVVSLGALAWVLASQDLHGVVRALAQANYARFFVELAAFYVVVVLLDAAYLWASVRWMAGVGDFFEMLRARCAAYLLAVINLLAGLGGTALYLRRRHGVPYARGAAIMLNELVQDAGAMGALLLAGAFFTDTSDLQEQTRLYFRAAIGLGVFTTGLWVTMFVVSRLWQRFSDRLRPPAAVVPFLELRAGHFAGLFAIKLAKCVVFAVFVFAALRHFAIRPPWDIGLPLVQVALFARGLPVSAFGLGVDQITFPALLLPWAPGGQASQVLAFSLVYTTSVTMGRLVIALPFVSGVTRRMTSQMTAVDDDDERITPTPAQ